MSYLAAIEVTVIRTFFFEFILYIVLQTRQANISNITYNTMSTQLENLHHNSSSSYGMGLQVWVLNLVLVCWSWRGRPIQHWLMIRKSLTKKNSVAVQVATATDIIWNQVSGPSWAPKLTKSFTWLKASIKRFNFGFITFHVREYIAEIVKRQFVRWKSI